MAQYAEVALPGFESRTLQTVFNNAATEIPDKTAVLYETVSGYEHAVVIPTASAGVARTAGITVGAIAAGAYGVICVKGPALAIAGGALATGDHVMISDTTAHMGEAKAIVTSATSESLGHTLTAAAAQGDTFVVDVHPDIITKAAS
jgi:hypothetical protein